jgi:hypothetical protein
MIETSPRSIETRPGDRLPRSSVSGSGVPPNPVGRPAGARGTSLCHVDLATRKRLFNLCDPREILAPDDEPNVDVDSLPGAVRGRRWVEVLAGPSERGSP